MTTLPASVPIAASLAKTLRRHRDHQRLEREKADFLWQETGPMFATEVGSWTHPKILNRALAALLRWSDPAQWEKRCRAANWATRDNLEALGAVVRSGEHLPHVTPHDLRHTYATLALRRGTPVEVVSRTLGHARISITMDIYRHVLERKQWVAAVDLFDATSPERNSRPMAVA